MADAGAPTKLTDKMIEVARSYVQEKDTMNPNEVLPTIERLSIMLDVHRDTLYEWEKHSKEFSDILRKLRAAQADKLLQNALIGRYNPVITKLMLSKHGYVEKSEQDVTSGGEKIETNTIIFKDFKNDPTGK
jgi:hypothetical protein